mmetsp:Transcript_17863/g.28958  ORF Transcript_17863/g.28958 Transcript_17863/m.28958 type:complete len:245 (+) Transcript_17863:31-765(+)
MTDELVLDPKIRNWVLLPILLVMILVQIGRSWVQVLLKGNSSGANENVKHMQLLSRSAKLRANNRLLTPVAFNMRLDYFSKKGGGKLRQKVAGGAPNPMQNPEGMMDMMKGNLTMMIPNIVMMGWISYFFSGFVLVKVPFMLTEGFKQMLQRGVELQTLDVSYVSSLSWYFLVMFGLRGLFTLILGENSVPDDTKMMQQQMGMGGANAMQFDPKKAYKAEKTALKYVEHNCVIDDAEEKFLNSK